MTTVEGTAEKGTGGEEGEGTGCKVGCCRGGGEGGEGLDVEGGGMEKGSVGFMEGYYFL